MPRIVVQGLASRASESLESVENAAERLRRWVSTPQVGRRCQQVSAESLMAFLKWHVRSEFSDCARAVFCLWFEQLMEVVSDSARVRPVPERSNRDIRVAHRVHGLPLAVRSSWPTPGAQQTQ